MIDNFDDLFEWCNDASAEKGAKAPKAAFAKYQELGFIKNGACRDIT